MKNKPIYRKCGSIDSVKNGHNYCGDLYKRRAVGFGYGYVTQK